MAVDGYGFIKISRKLYAADPFWNEPRVFSRHEAWEDLIQSAAWSAHERTTASGVVTLERGQVLVSERFLAERWQWGRKKVRGFLDVLQKMGRISAHQTNQSGTTYTLCNYETYQGWGATDAPPEEPPRNHLGTTQEPPRGQREVSKYIKGSEAGKAVQNEGEAVVARTRADAPARTSGEAQPIDLGREGEISTVIRTANRGMSDNELLPDFRPILTTGDGRQAVAEWLDEGIPAATIEIAVYHAAKSFEPSGEWPQIKKMGYFDAAVRRQHEAEQAKLTPAPKGTPAGTIPPDSEAASANRRIKRDEKNREVYESRPGKRTNSVTTIGEKERDAEAQAEREDRLIAEWIDANPDDADDIMTRVKAWLDSRPEWSGERRKFAAPIVRSEYRRRIWQRISDKQQHANAAAQGEG